MFGLPAAPPEVDAARCIPLFQATRLRHGILWPSASDILEVLGLPRPELQHSRIARKPAIQGYPNLLLQEYG